MSVPSPSFTMQSPFASPVWLPLRLLRIVLALFLRVQRERESCPVGCEHECAFGDNGLIRERLVPDRRLVPLTCRDVERELRHKLGW